MNACERKLMASLKRRRSGAPGAITTGSRKTSDIVQSAAARRMVPGVQRDDALMVAVRTIAQ
jgi:hypothetical protein